MAGSIAGAYVGDANINANLRRHCESHEEIDQLAENLFNSIGNV